MKYIILGIILLMISHFHAQVTITINNNKEDGMVKTKVEIYSDKIDSLVTAEKKQMKKEIEEVNDQLSEGDITEEQADELKSEISEKYADRIDEGVEDLQMELEEIIDEQVNVSLYGIEEDDDESEELEIKISSGNKTNKRKYKRSRYMIGSTSLGFSNLTNGWDLGSMNDSGLKFGKSVDFTFGPILQFQPTITSPVTLITGFNFRSNNLRASGKNFFTENQNGEVLFAPAPYDRLRKAKLRTNSLFIPIGAKFSFRKTETDDDGMEYRNVRKGFYVGTLFYAGLNLSSKSIVKYFNEDGNKRKDKYNMDSVNDLLYGMEFNFGYNGYNFYIRKDFSDYFDKTTFPVNNGIEFGMRFGF